MAEHIEAQADGTIKIWWDNPEEEDPNFGEDGQAIETADRMRDGVVLKEFEYLTTVNLYEAAVPRIVERLHELAREKLGPGKVYEIRGKIPTNYGMSRGLAWYTAKWMQQETTFLALDYPGKLNELGGYMFLGRFKT